MRIRGYGLYSILPREHSQKWVRLIKLVVSEIQNFSVSDGMLGASAIFTKSPQSPETPPPLTGGVSQGLLERRHFHACASSSAHKPNMCAVLVDYGNVVFKHRRVALAAKGNGVHKTRRFWLEQRVAVIIP